MKVKLKDSIISELRALGLRPGDIVKCEQFTETTGAVDFSFLYNGFPQQCVVWPEDYEIVDENQPEPVPETVTAPAEITVPIAEMTNALDAMHWCFSPYLDNSDMSESPWIENLVKFYNSIVSILPSPWNLQYEPVDY
jgi:hypothetical protein